ncbi:hypothetical protein XELAEV_18007408mg [Xenopus laevis]|uniref:Transmembrane protein n=1 Tax=Xenopus laevis TaxID=8355 RepID=A0A974I501_XENLA|nr:hypothetical protein XELAEV_18007408mg [Xenopus laevis]
MGSFSINHLLFSINMDCTVIAELQTARAFKVNVQEQIQNVTLFLMCYDVEIFINIYFFYFYNKIFILKLICVHSFY